VLSRRAGDAKSTAALYDLHIAEGGRRRSHVASLYDERTVINVPTSLPGGDLVADGLADLRAGRETPAALLVMMASARLRALGFEVPVSAAGEAFHRLYELLERDGPGAHSRYNALVRRMVSFARAAEHDHSR
jgi:hypothetical protein